MSPQLFLKDSGKSTEIYKRLPPSVKPFLEIYDVGSVDGLMKATVCGVMSYPTLIVDGEFYTSINEIIDVLERMAVELGDEPPFKG